MPIPLISSILFDGLSSVPYGYTLVKVILTYGIVYLLKLYFSGTNNTSERVLHGKVAIITGGTSGVGGAVALELAGRGCQIVFLTRHPLSDPFLVDYIEDLRTRTGNELITAEQVDLADLHSIRKFATKWIDNAPPRRLDFLVLCADEMTTANAKVLKSKNGVEIMTAVNYLSNFHLLSILSPAIKAQPKDRDVRIIAGVCCSYMGGDLTELNDTNETRQKQKGGKSGKGMKSVSSSSTVKSSSQMYAATKLAMLTFCSALQKHFAAVPQKDGLPSNLRVLCVDPGWTRTAGMLRYLTRGSLWGLLVYVIMYPFWWLVLKSPAQGAQSFLWAAMDAQFFGVEEPYLALIKECRVVRIMRSEVNDEKVQKKLWEVTEKNIEALEKEAAMKRARDKKATDEKGNSKATSSS